MAGNPFNPIGRGRRGYLVGSCSALAILSSVFFYLKPSVPAALLAAGTAALLFIAANFLVQDAFPLKRFIPVLFTVAILFPYIRLHSAIPDIRPELVIVLAALFLLLLGRLAGGDPIRLRRCPAHKWFGLFAFSIILSMTYAPLFNGQPVILRDFWELIKLGLYFLIFLLVASNPIDPAELKRYYRFSLIILLLSAFIGFLQYVNFAGINQLVSPYYAPTQMQGLLVHGRITGTTPNPNEFGALMVLAASLAFSGALFFRENLMRYLCWAALPLYVFALVLTLSRTSLVALALSFFMIAFFFFKERGLRINPVYLFLVILLILLGGTLILHFAPAKALTRFGELATFSKTTSFLGRVEIWGTQFAYWLESPWFGWGPGKFDMETIVDNEWLLLLRRYGVVGLAVFITLFGSLFSGLSTMGKKASEPAVLALSVALRATFAGYVVYMGLSVIYHSLQLMPIILLFLGLIYTQWRPALWTSGVTSCQGEPNISPPGGCRPSVSPLLQGRPGGAS